MTHVTNPTIEPWGNEELEREIAALRLEPDHFDVWDDSAPQTYALTGLTPTEGRSNPIAQRRSRRARPPEARRPPGLMELADTCAAYAALLGVFAVACASVVSMTAIALAAIALA